MNKLSKGTLLIAIGVFALGAAAGAGGTFLVTDKKEPASATQAEDNKKREVTDHIEPDTSVPAGTLSPTEVVNNIKNYNGKDISMHGMLVKLPDGKFLLSGKETKDSKSISVVFTDQSLKVDEFVSIDSNSSPEQPKGTFTPVTVKGTVSNNDEGRPSFNASSVTK